MRKTTSFAVIAAMACLMFSVPSPAVSKEAKPGYYWNEEEVRGFYWKEVPPEKKVEADKADPKQSHPTPPKHLKLDDYPIEQLWSMDPVEFEKLSDQFRNQSIRTLEEEDVRAYMAMQDLARRKALGYMNVHQLVLQKNPELSVEREKPIATPGIRALSKQRSEEDVQMFTSSRGDFALVYLTENNCPLCEPQKKIIDAFINRFKWDARLINLDEQPSFRKAFNVKQTPTLLLVKSDGEHLPIAYGVVALPYLYDRIYGGIRLLRKEITAAEYHSRESLRGTSMDPLAPVRK